MICFSKSYGCICCKLWVTKFLILILVSVFNLISFLHFKKINNNVSTIRLYLTSTLYVIIAWILLKYIQVTSWVIILSDNIEMNLVPKHNYFSSQGLTICHWNSNSISAQMYRKNPRLSVFIFIHKFNIIFPWETYLSSNPLYNSKRREACVYYRNLLPLKVIDVKFLQECIPSFEIGVGEKCCKLSWNNLNWP